MFLHFSHSNFRTVHSVPQFCIFRFKYMHINNSYYRSLKIGQYFFQHTNFLNKQSSYHQNLSSIKMSIIVYKIRNNQMKIVKFSGKINSHFDIKFSY